MMVKFVEKNNSLAAIACNQKNQMDRDLTKIQEFFDVDIKLNWEIDFMMIESQISWIVLDAKKGKIAP